MPELFQPVLVGAITVETYLICTLAAFGCGILAALSSAFRTHSSKSFLITLILLPPIVETVIFMVNGNVGTGIAVAGAFSLVRFRSVPGKAREIVSIFMAMTAGLACASGYIGIALLFSLLLSAVMLLLTWIPLSTDREMELRMTVPESLNFYGAFDDLFEEYTKRSRLVGVKTTNMGSLYKLKYKVQLKDPQKAKEMIDALRCRNGNLEISLNDSAERNEEL